MDKSRFDCRKLCIVRFLRNGVVSSVPLAAPMNATLQKLANDFVAAQPQQGPLNRDLHEDVLSGRDTFQIPARDKLNDQARP